MKKLVFIIFSILFITFLFSEGNLDKLDLLSKEMKFIYKIPENSIIVPLVKQEDVLYYIGFSNDNCNMEYRISAYPISQLPDNTTFKTKDELKKSLEVLAWAIALNISQDENIKLEYYYFNDHDVKNEFGGDVGFSIVVNGNSNFSKGYKFIKKIME